MNEAKMVTIDFLCGSLRRNLSPTSRLAKLLYFALALFRSINPLVAHSKIRVPILCKQLFLAVAFQISC